MKTNSIITINNIEENSEFLGNKTLYLKKLIDFGFNVPEFIAIPSYALKDIEAKPERIEQILLEIKQNLPRSTYAVRSSSLIEDTRAKSYAGQFLTKINVSENDLRENILLVLQQAKEYLNKNTEKFSIIIQEYIEPDIFGVTFTRNPLGSREMVVEYGICTGEKVVGGAIIPNKINLYWNSIKNTTIPEFFIKNDIIKSFIKIEEDFNFPQDIEWCIQNDIFYILQTRPITTISDDTYKSILSLENLLPKGVYFYFEKTELSEMTPKPCGFTFDLLNYIYADNGPVSNVYRKYNVNYFDTKFLKIIGNELYVDREKEIISLLPAYTYGKGYKRHLTFKKLGDIITTIKNIFYLNRIKTNSYSEAFVILKKYFLSPTQSDFKKALDTFLKEYEIIFEINLKSSLANKKMEIYLRKESISLPDIFSSIDVFVNLDDFILPKINYKLVGNSIEIADESIFSQSPKAIRSTVNDWWGQTPTYKKNVLKKIIVPALIYNHMREMARALMVKNISILRTTLLDIAKEHHFTTPHNIYFSTIQNIIDSNITEEQCKNKQDKYMSYNNLIYPTILASFIDQKIQKIQGVSAGVAEGILVTKEMLGTIAQKNNILYTEILSPDLINYFDKISGIVSNNGGLLSHMAIIARENNIPVIVGFDISKNQINIGDLVSIDGSLGKVVKI